MRRTIYYYYNRHAGLVFRYSDSNGNYATHSYMFYSFRKAFADSAKSSGWNINPSSSLTCIRSRFFFLKNNKENFYAEIKSRSKKRNTKNY